MVNPKGTAGSDSSGARKSVWRMVVIRLCVYYLLYAAAAFFLQSHLLFPGQRRKDRPEAAWPRGRTEHWTVEAGDLQVPAVLMCPESMPPRAVVIVGHGNAELIEDWADLGEVITGSGAAVLLVEFPGYGEASGKPSRRTLNAVFLRAREMVEESAALREVPVVGLGRSVGSGPVCELARRGLLERVALLAPFDSLDPMVHRMGLPAVLLRSRYDNREALRGFGGPVWIAHGSDDRVIPADHSRRLAAATQRVELHVVDSGHNDLLWEAGPELWDEMVAFLLRGSSHS